MKKYWASVICMLAAGFAMAQNPAASTKPFIHPGEELTYKVSYGILSVGEAKIVTSTEVYYLDQQPCYKVDISGKTTGAVGWVAKVDDRWGSYLSQQELLPIKSYRVVRENNYKRDEVTHFDFEKKQVRYLRYNYNEGKFNAPKVMDFQDIVRDLVGGYQYLRQLDYKSMHTGDTLHLAGFFEDDFYNFKILYKGKEKIKTQFGKIKAIKLVPVMPNNKVFDGENSITLWISDDDNRIPLKAEANMFIGTASCEIISYENLKKNLGFAGK